jgi:hypothetical protein
MYGKILAQPGPRDALVEHPLEASRLVASVPSCELYIINLAASEPDAIWVTEVWRRAEDHAASLQLDSGSDRILLEPVGGKGLTSS